MVINGRFCTPSVAPVKTPKLNRMIDTATAENDQIENSDLKKTRWPALWRHARTLMYAYAVVLLLVVSVQAVCLSLLWRPPQDWVSFGTRFATSPAAAGVFAVIAALITAWQLSRKTANEAWWQQFEWVTDRIITPREKIGKDDAQLPSSLAFDLMTSLSQTAKAPFQRDAVGGILNHYLNDVVKQRKQSRAPGDIPPSGGPGADTAEGHGLDAAGANSLRNLIEVLPQSSSAPARNVLAAYERDYVDEVLKALRHRFRAVQSYEPGLHEADAIIQVGSQKVIAEVRSSIRTRSMVTKVGSALRHIMSREKANGGVIITARASSSMQLQDLAKDGIHLIEWDPSAGSFALYSELTRVFGDNAA